MSNDYIKGIGMMVGMTMGAGFFALPFALSKAGFFWGMAQMVLALAVVLVLTLLYGEVAFFTKTKHRFIGYAEVYLGPWAKKSLAVLIIVSNFCSLLIYGLLSGIFLSSIFKFFGYNGLSFDASILIFFVIGSLFSFLHLKKIGELSFWTTLPTVIFIFVVMLLSFNKISYENLFATSGFFNVSWFLPLGIWLFSLDGLAVVPDTKEITAGISFKSFRKILVLSVIMVAVFYLAFTISVYGIIGNNVTEDALSSLFGVLDSKVVIFGLIASILSMLDSFAGLSAVSRSMFRYDFGLNRTWAWALGSLPPIALYFAGVSDYSKIINFLGTVVFGLGGMFIILMARSLRNKIKNNDFGEEIYPEAKDNAAKLSGFTMALVFVVVTAVAFYEIYKILS